MAVKVVCHELWHKYKDGLSPQLSDLLDNIVEDFRHYKETGEFPHYMGRDYPYVEPYTALQADLMHVHIAVPPVEFRDGVPQEDRCCPSGHPEHDAALVYCRGALEHDTYCLIALLWPNAHSEARCRQTMAGLARHAQAWQDEH